MQLGGVYNAPDLTPQGSRTTTGQIDTGPKNLLVISLHSCLPSLRKARPCSERCYVPNAGCISNWTPERASCSPLRFSCFFYRVAGGVGRTGLPRRPHSPGHALLPPRLVQAGPSLDALD